MIRDKIEYIMMLIQLFAKRYDLTFAQAYRYISRYQGIEYAEEHYNILHTLSFADQIEGLSHFCHRNGGQLL